MLAIAGERIGSIVRNVAAAGALCVIAACAAPAAKPQQMAAMSGVKVGDLCEQTMSLDVSGFYFSKCVDYLNSHAQPQKVAANVSGPAEHRACGAIGLADGSPEFQRCVQEMYQLDLGAQHL